MGASGPLPVTFGSFFVFCGACASLFSERKSSPVLSFSLYVFLLLLIVVRFVVQFPAFFRSFSVVLRGVLQPLSAAGFALHAFPLVFSFSAAVFRPFSGAFSEAFPTVSLVSFGVVRFVVRFVVRVFSVEGACCEAGASMVPASWSEGWPCVACSGAAAPANFFSYENYLCRFSL